MSERRFSESEIREVFERAAAEQERAVRRASDDGLTLAEMQEVATSAGISAEFVASAARSVALGEPEQGRLMVGPIPRGVYRTELLPAPPSDALWESLVADLRRTFSAQGKVSQVGRAREWHNSNLRVTLEPAGDGSRLRLQTRRPQYVEMAALASVVAAIGLLLAFVSSLNIGINPELMTNGLLMALGGSGSALAVGIGQRTWASAREQQMEEVADRARERSAEEVRPALSSGSSDSARIDPGLLDETPVWDDEAVFTGARRRTRG